MPIKINKIAVIANGCDSLLLDGQWIKQQLESFNIVLVNNFRNADIVILLGCTFSANQENQFLEKIDFFAKSIGRNHLLIVSGCFLSIASMAPNVIFAKKEKVCGIVGKFLGISLDKTDFSIDNASIIQPAIAISEGCYGSCSYCSVKLVRGRHRSRPLDQIIREAHAVYKSCGKVKLAGQDISAYGQDIGLSFAQLLTEIYLQIPEIQLELNSLNPCWLAQMSDKELSLLADSRITGNIHVPLQSASERILKLMQREYTFADFSSIWQRLKHVGVVHMSTDMMAGFPTEDESDHEANMDFLSNQQLEFAQIFMFESRPGTEAAKLPQLLRDTKLRRSLDLIGQYITTYLDTHGQCAFNINDILNTNLQLEKEQVICDEC